MYYFCLLFTDWFMVTFISGCRVQWSEVEDTNKLLGLTMRNTLTAKAKYIYFMVKQFDNTVFFLLTFI